MLASLANAFMAADNLRHKHWAFALGFFMIAIAFGAQAKWIVLKRETK